MNKLIVFLNYKFLILHRKLKSFGLAYWLLYPILLFVFFILSQLPTLNVGEQYGDYILAMLSVSSIFQFGLKKEEIQWLSMFDKAIIYRVSILLILGIPFLILAIYLNYEITIGATILAIVSFSFYQYEVSFSFLEKLNLSFLMLDFEFVEGIRKFCHLHLVGIVLFGIGLGIENYNLAIFGYFSTLIIISFYYQTPEHPYLVWITGFDSSQFLLKKIVSISKKVALVSIPFVVLYFIFAKNLAIFFVLLVSILAIINVMLSKYVMIKTDFSIPIFQILAITLLMLSFTNPIYFLLSLGYMFFLRKKAITELNTILKNE